MEKIKLLTITKSNVKDNKALFDYFNEYNLINQALFWAIRSCKWMDKIKKEKEQNMGKIYEYIPISISI